MDYGIARLFPEYPAQVAGIHADSARDIRHGQVFPVMIVDTAQTGADKDSFLGSALHGLCGILQQAFPSAGCIPLDRHSHRSDGRSSGPALSAAFIRSLRQQLPAPFLKGHPGIPDGGSGTAYSLLPLKQPMKQRNGFFGVPFPQCRRYPLSTFLPRQAYFLRFRSFPVKVQFPGTIRKPVSQSGSRLFIKALQISCPLFPCR